MRLDEIIVMSEEKPMSAVKMAAVGGIINVLFAGGLMIGILPNLVQSLDPSVLAGVAVLSGLMLAGAGMAFSSPDKAKTGGYIVMVGGLIAIFEPLGFILGLMSGSLLMRFQTASTTSDATATTETTTE